VKDFLERASTLYYSGTPILSDEEYDSLAEKYNVESVGHVVTDGLPHLYKMYSLQKVFDMEEAPFKDGVCTPKLDGAAISILYVNGHLALALTRGDGDIGRDITDKIRLLVPEQISSGGEVQITGEVVCPSRVPNARNVAAGSLNLKSIKDFEDRMSDLAFVAYDSSLPSYSLWTEMLSFLETEGFNVVTSFDATDYPTDGLVYRIDSIGSFNKLGYTAHHPRGAFAFKEQKQGVVSKLLNVV